MTNVKPHSPDCFGNDRSPTRKRCVIVSPHFPPSTLAGVHRARHLAKHLGSYDWDPTIVCVDPKHHVEKLDPGLAALVPDTVNEVRTGAVPVYLTRPFGLAGDIGLRGFIHLWAALEKVVTEKRPQVVMITGSPYYPMLLSSWIKRRWGLPVLLDFQDPWVSAHGATRSRFSKGGLVHRFALELEPRAIRGAAFITSVSERQNTEMMSRYPWIDPSRMEAIPIGGDPEDFCSLRGGNDRSVTRSSHLSNAHVNISYAGTIWPPVIHTLRVVLQALSVLRDRSPVAARRIRLNFVGTSANPNGQDQRVMPWAKDIGVDNLVYEVAERRPFLEALRLMAQTDVNLMIGSDEPHYTASKIYPGMMSGRPFLSVFHRASSAHQILSAAGGGIALAFEGRDELSALVPIIAQALERIAIDPRLLGKIDQSAYAPYTAHAIAGRYADLFNRATS